MRNDKVPSSVETLVWIDGEGYSYAQLRQAVLYTRIRIPLVGEVQNPDRTVYEVDAPPPVPNVGQDFRYIGTPGIPSEVRAKLGNIDLPRGEAGDDYASLQERVAIIEQSYLMRIEAIEADAKSEREYVRRTFRSLEEWLTKLHGRLTKIRIGVGGLLFLYPGDWND